MATTATVTLAQCILNFFYAAASAVLTMIKAFVESLILFIDSIIAQLVAWLSILDILALTVEAAWAFFEAILDQLKNALLGGIQKLGPVGELCPEFYAAFTDPAVALIESYSTFSVYKDQWVNTLSLSVKFNGLLTYWNLTKSVLTETLVVLEDALAHQMDAEAIIAKQEAEA